MAEPRSPLMAVVRRALSRQSSATTVTITRVSGTPEEPEPETVVITSERPEESPAHRMARLALGVALLAIAIAVIGASWRRRR